MSDVLADQRVALKHGAGGRAMRQLIEDVFLERITPLPGAVGPDAMDDGAALPVGERWLVVTTDSHVVRPVFFPGGDIGRLAVCAAVNNLAVMGATEILGLTCAVVLEEGYPRTDLEHIQQSIHNACREAGTSVIAGDTRVMGLGEVDGIILNTTGVALASSVVRDNALRAGDVLIVTGTAGDHGMAILAARRGLTVESAILSDVAPLNGLIRLALEAANGALSAMKDPSRGGLASALAEMARKSGVAVVVRERDIPLSAQARAARDWLSIDPLHVANAGSAIIGVRPAAADRVLQALRSHPLGRSAAIVGECTEGIAGEVLLDTGTALRSLIEPDGEPPPRLT
jgi:hydrogenase expression/formation protein HypE